MVQSGPVFYTDERLLEDNLQIQREVLWNNKNITIITGNFIYRKDWHAVGTENTKI